MSQEELFPEIEDKDRALIEQLIAATRLYRTSTAVQELLDFTIRLRRFAPFNALLLHIQKPGLTFAASAHDWFQRFGRVPKQGVRPLLILRTMGPVDFVFDVQDTEGRDLPESIYNFPTLGKLSEQQFTAITQKIMKQSIRLVRLNHGEGRAGWIKRVKPPKSKKDKAIYHLAYNSNHSAATRLVTIAHELAHLFLGHLGADGGFKIKDRHERTKDEREVEAEMVAYIVAQRSGLTPRSESYLSIYQGAFENLDLFAITRAANAVETLMGVAAHQLKADI
jgi:hypothetical protein